MKVKNVNYASCSQKQINPKEYLEPCDTYRMELSAKLVDNNSYLSTIFVSFVKDFREGP